jgi:Neurotransmitter-gated ion-channel ligand binding domain
MYLLSKMIVRRLRKFCIGILISLLLWAVSVNAGPYTASSAQSQSTGKVDVSDQVTSTLSASSEISSSAVTSTATIFPSYLASPLNVGVAMIINKVKEINEQEGTFSADIALILRWKDPELSFDPVLEGTDRKLFSGEAADKFLSKIWLPGVEMSNISGQPSSKSSGVYVYPDGEIAYNQNISADFEHRFALDNFPFDIQRLSVSLVSKNLPLSYVVLRHDQLDADTSSLRPGAVRLAGWEAKDLEFSISKYQGWDQNYYSQIDATITVERDSLTHIPGMFIPFALIILLPTIMSLWAPDIDFEKRLSAWAGSILTLLALVFTLAIKYPLLQPDNLFYAMLWTGFAFQFIMLLIVATLFNPALKYKLGDKYVIDEIAHVFRWFLPLGLFIFLARMILLSMHSYSL